MDKKIKIGIIGGAGYTGGETTRLLVHHPHADIRFVQSRSQAGKKVSEVHKDLLGECDLQFTATISEEVEVLFLCLGHGESMAFMTETTLPSSTRVIDLSQDFRLGQSLGDREFVYGLPELQKEKIEAAQNIANPGCFATAIQLGLLPLANAGLLSEIHTTGITGSTGAGQKLQDTSHFSWRNNNVSAYKTLTHQHLNEINQTLKVLQANYNSELYFIPWRGNFTRGIFVSSVVKSELSLDASIALFEKYYSSAPFVHLSPTMIDLKQVVNTNKCLIHIEKEGNNLVVHTAIDNLIKGASGQAIQNMNLMFGVAETAGLQLKASVY
ncbi:MAG: N-acetyl-gamma-glutamyl-phosphate reductase [Cyclobacteriaceae bacterium]